MAQRRMVSHHMLPVRALTGQGNQNCNQRCVFTHICPDDNCGFPIRLDDAIG